MSRLVLKDGTIIPLTVKQSTNLQLAIVFSKDIHNKKVKVGDRVFSLMDIVDDPKEIERLTQKPLDLNDKAGTRHIKI